MTLRRMVGFILKAFGTRQLKKYCIHTKSFYSRQTCIFTLCNAEMKGRKLFEILEISLNICPIRDAPLSSSFSVSASAPYNAPQKHESTLLHKYVLNEFLTADRSFITKYFRKNSHKSW